VLRARALGDVGVGVAADVLANVCGVQVNAPVIVEHVISNDEPLVGKCTDQNGAPFEVTGAAWPTHIVVGQLDPTRSAYPSRRTW
jgi:hypothetical protein